MEGKREALENKKRYNSGPDGGMAGFFNKPEVIERLMKNPATAHPETFKMLNEIKQDQSKMN